MNFDSFEILLYGLFAFIGGGIIGWLMKGLSKVADKDE